ncbi:MAG: dethiobiotin synthase [Bacteroidetes bacterium]|nr:dethiobiotin synthase [Bacteroidota bacterium]
MNYFISGIGTNVGKTIVSAILTEALHADYWKPIQSGTIDGRDSETVKSLISNVISNIYPEIYLLKEPLSPHFAAKIEGIEIELEKIQLPKKNNPSINTTSVEVKNRIIIEGAGGLLVPISKCKYVIDIAEKSDCEVILVISNYLGCINHSLLSINYLLENHFKIKALVFNGEFAPEVKQVIIEYSPHIATIEIPTLKEVSREYVLEVARTIKDKYFKLEQYN